MSALIVRNHEHVLLFYPDSAEGRPFHRDEAPKASDRERILIVRAQRALDLLVTVIECLELDHIAPIVRALDIIRSALDVERARLGLVPRCDTTS